jgi:subtilase family serine protease
MCCPVAFFLLATVFSVQAVSTRQVLRGHVPEPVPHLTAVARLPASQQLYLSIGLPLRNPEALTSLLQQIYDPSSPSYHQFLTLAQFKNRFCPSEQDYLALIEFAKTNGLSVTGLHANRMIVNVGGSVGDIERVFHVTLRAYKHPAEARSFYAPDVEPSLDRQVAVNDISGLSDFGKPHPNYILQQKGLVSKAISNAGSGSGGSYKGYDFRAAYLPSVSLTGAGQTVALVQFDGYLASDIAVYESQAGLPAVTRIQLIGNNLTLA